MEVLWQPGVVLKTGLYNDSFNTCYGIVYTIALGIVPSFWVYISFFCLFGIVMPMFNTPSTVLLQERLKVSF